MKTFDSFADSRIGSWVVQGLAVVAFIVALKLLSSRLPEDGPLGAVKAGIAIV
jgi:hypothetical protein